MKKKTVTISFEDAQMYLLIKGIMDNVEAFAQYAAIRHVEMQLTDTMSKFDFEKHTITLHDLTRWMMKKEPGLLKLIDKAVNKVYKEKK